MHENIERRIDKMNLKTIKIMVGLYVIGAIMETYGAFMMREPLQALSLNYSVEFVMLMVGVTLIGLSAGIGIGAQE
jgi:hypothetical protein